MKLDKLEYPETKVVKMTFSASPEELEAGAQAVYERTRKDYTIKGFEKGQADRAAIEAERGGHVFWYDAINDIMDRDVGALMDAALAENKLESVGDPTYDLVSVKKEDGFVATASIALKPELALDTYTGFNVKATPIAVNEKEIDAMLERSRAMHAELVPHKGPAVKGNIVHIDYKGTIDGEEFEGGSNENYKLTLGKGTMIPGFEEGVLGHQAGDEFDLDLVFPKTYRQRDYAGKAVKFHVVLKDVCVSQLPSLNSDFAKLAGKVDTMEEYRASLREKLAERNKAQALSRARNELLADLAKAVKGDLPSLMVEMQYQRELQDFSAQMQMMRMNLGQFLQQTRQTKEEFLDRMRKTSEMHLRVNYGLKLIAEKENLMPSDADLDAELQKRAERAKKTVEEYTANGVSREKVAENMGTTKAREFLLEHSTIEECDPEPLKKGEINPF